MPLWARLITAVAAFRVSTTLVVYLAGHSQTDLPLPAWAYAAFAIVFTAVGSLLVVGSRRDPRAAWLGGVFLLLTTPVSPTVLGALPWTAWLVFVRPDSFLPFFTWRFVDEFPSPLTGSLHRAVRGIAAVCAIVGIACALVNVSYIAIPQSTDGSDWRLILTAGPRIAQSWFWLAVTGLSSAAFPFLLWRQRRTSSVERHRIAVFLWGFVGGMLPFAVEVTLEGLLPFYRRLAHAPAVEPWIGALIFAPFAAVPLVTAYSVLFDKVVDVRFVLRMAAQYALARYTIIGFGLIPFAALAYFLVQQRDQPIVTLLTGPRPLLLGGAVALGVVAFRLRRGWLESLDRRFFRESYDAQQVMTRLLGGLQVVDANELGTIIQRELGSALHTTVEMFVFDESHSVLRHVQGKYPALPSRATVLSLALGDSQPMDVDMRGESALRRLPASEQEWLERGGFSSLVCLRGSGGRATGLLALARKQSELAYSNADRQMLIAVASAAGLALDNLRLRSNPDSSGEPAACECPDCARLSPAGTERCECGGRLVTASVPLMLRGVFQLQRRIGAGGMGVVYRATDLELGRDVAVKTLPGVTPESVTRLRKEARAMARLTHQNLAVVHGIETWRGCPFLIEEYLEGGTLKERLAAERLPMAEVLDLGCTLADVLEYLHRSGMVHCDIKPSNIGMSHAGTLKLLDFGLANLLHDIKTTAGTSMTTVPPEARERDLSSVSYYPGAGTPQYMSPEAIRGERPRPSFDLWSLGVVLFEAISGARPYESRDPAELLHLMTNGDLPPLTHRTESEIELLTPSFRKILAVDIRDRPQTATEFRNELNRLRSARAGV